MPLYEYQCPQCGRFELIQKFADPALTSCPTCSSTVEKLLSAPAIQFKGTGWYITDYARKSSDGGAKGDSAKGDGGKGDSGKGESAKGDGAKSEPAKTSDSSSSSGTSASGGGSSTSTTSPK